MDRQLPVRLARLFILSLAIGFLPCGRAGADTTSDPELLQKLHDGKFDQIDDGFAGKLDLWMTLHALRDSGFVVNDLSGIDTDAVSLTRSGRYFFDPRLLLYPYPNHPTALAVAALVNKKGANDAWVQSMGRNAMILVMNRADALLGPRAKEPRGMSDADFQNLGKAAPGERSPRALAIKSYLKSRLVQDFPDSDLTVGANLIEQKIKACSLPRSYQESWYFGNGDNRELQLFKISGLAKSRDVPKDISAVAKQLVVEITHCMSESMLSFMPGLWEPILEKMQIEKLPDDYRGPGALFRTRSASGWGVMVAGGMKVNPRKSGIPENILKAPVLACEYTTDDHRYIHEQLYWLKSAPADWDKVKGTLPLDHPLLQIQPAREAAPPRDPSVAAKESAAKLSSTLVRAKPASAAATRRPPDASKNVKSNVPPEGTSSAKPKEKEPTVQRPKLPAKASDPAPPAEDKTVSPTPVPDPAPAVPMPKALAPPADPHPDAQPALGDAKVSETPAYTYAFISTQTTGNKLAASITEATGKVVAAIQNGSIQPAGPFVLTFHGATLDPDKPFTLDVGLQVKAGSKAPDGIAIKSVPATRCVSVISSGPSTQVGQAYAKAYGEVAERHLHATEVNRQFLTHWEAPESKKNVIEVQVELEKEK